MDEKDYTVDRFENGFAVLTDNDANSFDIPRSHLPPEVTEGDVIRYEGEMFIIDKELSLIKREEIKSRFNRLKKKK